MAVAARLAFRKRRFEPPFRPSLLPFRIGIADISAGFTYTWSRGHLLFQRFGHWWIEMTSSKAHSTIQWILGTFVLCLGLPVVAQQPTAELRAARQRLIGTEIARVGDYAAYSPQATASGACPASYREPAAPPTQADLEKYWKALADAKRRISMEADSRRAPFNASLNAHNKEFRENRIDLVEFRRREKAVAVERSKVDSWQRAEEARVEKELSAPLNTANRVLQINLEHAPADPNATIVPLDSQFLPTAAYLANLNRALASFLKTCGSSDSVVVAHFYRDLFPNGVPADFEPPITSYRYALKSGALQLDESDLKSAMFLARHDPDRNPRLRLAIFKNRIDTRVAETSRIKAEYRADFLKASKRRPGIVYKLDPFWAQYPKSELARRIFDGDFAQYSKTSNFSWLYLVYGDYFSSRCAQHVKSWTTLLVPVSEPDGTVDNPVTGLPETRFRSSVDKLRLDSRFAPRYNEFEAAIRVYALSRAADAIKNGPNFATMTAREFFKLVPAVKDQLTPEGTDLEFLQNHACDSATMTQLGENIARASRGQPSLQADGVRLDNAERESDPTTLP